MTETIVPLWLLMAAVPALFYAVTNHLDKHLLDEHFQGSLGVNALVVVSAFVSVFALPFIWLAGVFLGDASLIPTEWTHLLVFALVGCLHVALIWFYLTALQSDDTTTIVVFYSFLPILGMLFSNWFLGETLSQLQLIAMMVIIVGVLIVSIEVSEKNGLRVKSKVIFLMLAASLCWALGDVVFKFVALEENVVRSLFWEHVFLTLVGVVMFIFMPKVKHQLRSALKQNSTKIIGINFTSEMLYIAANVISAFPLVMVQVAAVHLVQAFQPVWVFLIGVVLWRLKVSNESFTTTQLFQKGLATVIAVVGMYLLAVSTPI